MIRPRTRTLPSYYVAVHLPGNILLAALSLPSLRNTEDGYGVTLFFLLLVSRVQCDICREGSGCLRGKLPTLGRVQQLL